MSDETLSKAYSPAEVEAKWYPTWEKRGYFHSDVNSAKKAYTIVIPPPNVTGILTLYQGSIQFTVNNIDDIVINE